jgi:single-stranded-DNA-specific exonuclease
MKKTWEIKKSIKYKVSSIKTASRVKEIIEVLLYNRGLKTKKQIEQFLNPPDPYSLAPSDAGINTKQIVKAIKRIAKAIKAKENIIVYGDYDADGVCSTAIMWETLHALGAKVMPFIPNREDLGYGLKKAGIDQILSHYPLSIRQPADHNPSLIITVDNGIVANEGVQYAKQKGIDVIISDHHQPPTKLPAALAIVHSTQICGAGVAWFFAKELYQHFHKNLLGFKQSNALELACVGTVTDLMPVLETNRSIIFYGLKELRKTNRPGVLALCQETGVPQNQIDTFEIGFIIGPRVNAMGRLADALESLRLLCTNNHDRAKELALKLGLTNRRRQQLTINTFALARAKVGHQMAAQKSKLIFISDENYNQGVIGLVAGKLVEEFYKPAIVISQGKEYSKASVRSISGFNIIEALRKFDNLYEDLGGHPMAAGFTIATVKLTELKQKFGEYVEKKLTDKDLSPKINIDLEISLSDVNWEILDEISKLAPFGVGNPRPVFAVSEVKVVDFRLVGREQKHLKLQLTATEGQASIIDAIAFGQGAMAKKLLGNKMVAICFTIDKNIWNGNESLQLIIKDIRD